MAIEWRDDYAIGFTAIDEQHKALFNHINVLNEAINSRKGKEALRPLLGFLGEYVVMHFGTEQKLMIENEYPDYPLHRAQHDDFVETFLRARREFETEGSTATLAATVNGFVCGWLLRHVLGSDRKLGYFLQRKGFGGRPA